MQLFGLQEIGFFSPDCKNLPWTKVLPFLPQGPCRIQPVLDCLFEWIFQSTPIPWTFPQHSEKRLWNYSDSSAQPEATLSAEELFKLSDPSMCFHNFLTGSHRRNSSVVFVGEWRRGLKEIRTQEFTTALRTRGRVVFQTPMPLHTAFQNDLDTLEKRFEIGCNSAQTSTEQKEAG